MLAEILQFPLAYYIDFRWPTISIHVTGTTEPNR